MICFVCFFVDWISDYNTLISSQECTCMLKGLWWFGTPRLLVGWSRDWYRLLRWYSAISVVSLVHVRKYYHLAGHDTASAHKHYVPITNQIPDQCGSILQIPSIIACTDMQPPHLRKHFFDVSRNQHRQLIIHSSREEDSCWFWKVGGANTTSITAWYWSCNRIVVEGFEGEAKSYRPKWIRLNSHSYWATVTNFPQNLLAFEHSLRLDQGLLADKTDPKEMSQNLEIGEVI